jgi:type IV pilus assembly protein PilA
MLQKLIERRQKGQEEGFTLIELMVVVLIIAILIAIAIPTFLGARQRAQNRAAQSNGRNGLTAEKTIYTDAQQYTSTSATLTGVEPSLNFVADEVPGAANLNNEVAVSVGTTTNTNDTVYIGVKSKSGNCYYIKDTTGTPGTQYWNTGTCVATASTGVTGAVWANAWT